MIATDTISEGQNLQDCDTVVNYDIHWNPVRIVQRFGRVDRLGTTNASVQLVNFWPNIDLDAYINLETRVSSRMILLDVSATGEENILDVTSSEMNDLDYRRKQLQQMRDSVPTMEDLAGGLSITDLTLSDFRMDAAARDREESRRSPGGPWPCSASPASIRPSPTRGLPPAPSSCCACETTRSPSPSLTRWPPTPLCT